MLPSVYELPLEESEMDQPEVPTNYQPIVDWALSSYNNSLSAHYYVNRDGTISTVPITTIPANSTGLHWDYATGRDWSATVTTPAVFRGQTITGTWIDESYSVNNGRSLSVECQINALPVIDTTGYSYITTTTV